VRPGRLLRWARLATLVGALAGALYVARRLDLVVLPPEGCSPLVEVAPGSRLVVDTRPRPAWPGDLLLFRDPVEGTTLLGKVAAAPPSALDHHGAALEAGGLWLVADRPGCPARDSRTLGPIAPEAVRGRVLFTY